MIQNNTNISFKVRGSNYSFRSPQNSQLPNHFCLKAEYKSVENINQVEYSSQKAMR